MTLSSHLDDVSASPSRTALVLGGGGSTGNAWLIGVVAGLFDAGLDVTRADLTIGTSAGATAAAQIAGAPPTELYAAILSAAILSTDFPSSAQQQARSARPGAGRAPGNATADHLERLGGIIASSADAADLRRRMGSAALERAAAADPDGSWRDKWRATVATRLPAPDWPERAVFITAIDAETSEPVVFDRHSGVELVDAVAASCSSGLPYRIGDHLYLDGGYRVNAENADLASGYAKVLVLSPFGGRSLTPVEWGTHLATQVDRLRANGSEVEMVFPGSTSEHLFGPNAMDGSLRPAAARAGHDQGLALAEQLAGFWR